MFIYKHVCKLSKSQDRICDMTEFNYIFYWILKIVLIIFTNLAFTVVVETFLRYLIYIS